MTSNTSGRHRAQKFTSREAIPERTMIARIYRVDGLDDAKGGKLSIELDAIDESAVEARQEDGDYRKLLEDRGAVQPFGLLRLEIGGNEFERIAGIVAAPGLWFAIELVRSRQALEWVIDHSQLTEEGYTLASSGYVGGIEFIAQDDDPIPQPLGASVPLRRRTRQVAINNGVFPATALKRGAWRWLFFGHRRPVEVLVRDVGQASFVSFQDGQGKSSLHFDAGWPVSFNEKTAPPRGSIRPDPAPVILSHWDWDHLHGYYVFPQLQLVKWTTPAQALGPGASRVAAQLDAAGLLCGIRSSPRFHLGTLLWDRKTLTPWGRLGLCQGTGGNKNQTGLVMHVELTNSKLVLVTGDADYDLASNALGGCTRYDGMVITHHGAKHGGTIPSPTTKGAPAVLSYGQGNSYGHPHAASVSAAAAAGWTLHHTADLKGAPRGPRTIR